MYKILTDSCCDLPYDILKSGEVDFISMKIRLSENELLDDLGQKFDRENFYSQLRNGAMPSTSQVNVGRYVEFFSSYVEQKIPILYICFSSGMSGSYHSALQAAQMIKEDDPNAEIYVFDSLSASAGQGLMVYEAIEKQQTGYTLTELAGWLNQNKLNYNHWVTVDDLNHLYRGGRISKASAAIGEALSIKPILTVNNEGRLQVTEKKRTRKKSLQAIANKAVQSIIDFSDQTIIIAASDDYAGAELTKNMILEKIAPKEIKIVDMGPTVASHTGCNCIAVFTRGTKRSN